MIRDRELGRDRGRDVLTTGRKVGRTVGEAVTKRLGRVASRLQEESAVAVDVLESDDEYLLVLDAPGATAGDVQVRYDEGSVLVRIDRFRDHHEGFEMRYPGRGLALDARAELPERASVYPEAARAVLRDDGTLHVYLPKREDEADEAPEPHEDVEEWEDDAYEGDEPESDPDRPTAATVETTDDRDPAGRESGP